MSVNALPSELWMYIFSFACMDNGYTGRSLSLVSQTIHELSAPLKYQSICIARHKHLFNFLETFKQIPIHRRRLKYLCIATRDMVEDDSDNEDDDPNYEPSEDYGPVTERNIEDYLFSPFDGHNVEVQYDPEAECTSNSDEDTEDYEARVVCKAEGDELREDLDFFGSAEGEAGRGPTPEPVEFTVSDEIDFAEGIQVDAINALVALCHESLVHLTVHLVIHRGWGPHLKVPLPLPYLREFMTNVDVSFPRLSSSMEGSDQHFPQLRLLGLRVNALGDFMDQFRYFSPTSPRLTHLRLSLRDENIHEPQVVLKILPQTVQQCMLDLDPDFRGSYTRIDIETSGVDENEGENGRQGQGGDTGDEDHLQVPGWRYTKMPLAVERDWVNSGLVVAEWLNRMETVEAEEQKKKAHWDYPSLENEN